MLRRTPVLAAAVTTLLLAAGCSDDGSDKDSQKAVKPAPVEVSVKEPTAEPVKIGVLATLSTQRGQGADVLPGAEGARVAAYRLDMGGQDVELVVQDDAGTEVGARSAVEALVNQRVAAIVAATTGEHVVPALQDAADADTAVLLPYLRTSSELPANSWVTGPTATQVNEALKQSLAAHELSSPFVVTGDGVELSGISGAGSATYTPGGTDALVRQIQAAQKASQVDSVVIAASAESQADVVSSLQGGLAGIPTLMTPEALSPLFGDSLTKTGGTTSGRFITVGQDASDATTMTAGDRADAVASYFAGLRLVSTSTTTDLFGSVPFKQVAAGADTLSHDAVMTVVAAALEAGSTEAAEVLGALDGLKVDQGDGLAGPELDLSDQSALADGDVVELNATTQNPGVRPGHEAGQLYWFAVPVGTESG